MTSQKVSSQTLRQNDARKLASSILGTAPKTTAYKFSGSDPRNNNLMTASQTFLMNAPIIPDQLNITKSYEAISSGLLTSLATYMSPESQNLVPRDIMDRAIVGVQAGLTDRLLGVVSTGAGVAIDVKNAYSNARAALDGVFGGGSSVSDVAPVFGPPSNRKDGLQSLRFTAIKGYAATRQMGFAGDIQGIRPGDPRDHGKGLALDIMVHSDRKAGDIIADFFLQNRHEYKVKYIIWYDRIVGNGDDARWAQGWRHYDALKNTGSYTTTTRHQDHPHVSFHP